MLTDIKLRSRALNRGIACFKIRSTYLDRIYAGLEKHNMPYGNSDYSIFLSYARTDNEPEDDANRNEIGWVDYLQTRLLNQLRRHGRRDVAFWRDVAEIDGAERFSPKIMEGLNASYFFLPVLSPTYIQRPWCLKEINKFLEQHTYPKPEERLVPVFKLPVPSEQMLAPLQGRGSFHFYRYDEIAKKSIEFFRYGNVVETEKQRYDEELDNIVNSIMDRLPTSAPMQPIGNPSVDLSLLTIFVAKPADDMYSAYQKLVEELQTQGYRVVIDPADDGDPTPEDINDALDQANLVIHLLGQDTGKRLGKSRLVDFLLEQTYDSTLPRIIWAPKTLFFDPTHPDSDVREQDRIPQSVLEEFGDFRDSDSLSGDPFEAFLAHIVNRCRIMVSPNEVRVTSSSNGAFKVYVVGASDDAALVYQVTDELINAGLEAFPCGFQGDPADIQRLHEEEMRTADAVLYCWGEASDTAVRLYMREARNAMQLGREMPFRATALFPGPPLNSLKKSFRTSDVNLVLSPADEVTPQLFTALIETLQHGADR